MESLTVQKFGVRLLQRTLRRDLYITILTGGLLGSERRNVHKSQPNLCDWINIFDSKP